MVCLRPSLVDLGIFAAPSLNQARPRPLISLLVLRRTTWSDLFSPPQTATGPAWHHPTALGAPPPPPTAPVPRTRAGVSNSPIVGLEKSDGASCAPRLAANEVHWPSLNLASVLIDQHTPLACPPCLRGPSLVPTSQRLQISAGEKRPTFQNGSVKTPHDRPRWLKYPTCTSGMLFHTSEMREALARPAFAEIVPPSSLSPPMP